jgi:phospholipid/cholesterol/gamma-HCH transport system ATP-binding protein
MLKVESVAKSFGGLPVIKNVSFDVDDGEILGLVGPSGAGKSVLLKLAGMVTCPDAGTISNLSPSGDPRPVSVGFLFQEGALFDSMSVIENVAFPILCSHSARFKRVLAERCSFDQAMQQSFEMLKEVGLAEAYKKMPGQLSGGMRRRVALARALVCHPALVLLDDPTGGLDPVAANVIINLIKELHQHYHPTVLMVSHDIRRLLPNVGRVLALFDGRIVCDQKTALLAQKARPEVLRFLATRFDFSEDHDKRP